MPGPESQVSVTPAEDPVQFAIEWTNPQTESVVKLVRRYTDTELDRDDLQLTVATYTGVHAILTQINSLTKSTFRSHSDIATEMRDNLRTPNLHVCVGITQTAERLAKESGEDVSQIIKEFIAIQTNLLRAWAIEQAQITDPATIYFIMQIPFAGPDIYFYIRFMIIDILEETEEPINQRIIDAQMKANALYTHFDSTAEAFETIAASQKALEEALSLETLNKVTDLLSLPAIFGTENEELLERLQEVAGQYWENASRFTKLLNIYAVLNYIIAKTQEKRRDFDPEQGLSEYIKFLDALHGKKDS